VNLFQVNLFVGDFSAMLRFYRDVLGFEMNDLDPGPPCVPMVNWASFWAGGAIIELFDAAAFRGAEASRTDNRDAVQLCFIVDDVRRHRDRLVSAGVRCDDIVTQGWGQYASFRDPEENWLQIYEVFDQRT
jgi:catechol 2,3-dioxygenase-like lactoylglutathione lyase family enzyme